MNWVLDSGPRALELLLDEGVAGQRIAVQHHGAGADGLDTELAAAGADVASLVVYRWGPIPDPAALAASVRDAAAGEIDAVVFTSAPGAHAWLAAADAEGVPDGIIKRSTSGRLVAAAVGPITVIPLQDRGIEPIISDRGHLQVRRTVALLDGHVLPLSPSGLEVLRLLVDAHGDVASRADVLAVLPGDSTDPHAAEVAIGRLRAVGGRTLVQTVVKRGYRLGLT